MAGTKSKKIKDTSQDYESMLEVKTEQNLIKFLDDEDSDEFERVETWEKLWQGMPKYKPNNAEPIKQLMVNFDTWEDYFAFAKLIDHQLTEKTRSVYYPPRKTSVLDIFRWVDDGSNKEGETDVQ